MMEEAGRRVGGPTGFPVMESPNAMILTGSCAIPSPKALAANAARVSVILMFENVLKVLGEVSDESKPIVFCFCCFIPWLVVRSSR